MQLAALSDAQISRDKQADPKESAAWARVYGQNAEIRRRQLAMPGKLRRLGVHQAPRDAAILDMCCGHGEALNALYDMGFRNLSGMDLTIPETLAAEGQFAVRVGDACHPDYSAASFDWILNIHALHHLGGAEQVEQFLAESSRILKPGGRLSIVDFPASLQIRLAFWWLRQDVFLWTPHLENIGRMVQEEWHFLKEYLRQWRRVRQLLYKGWFELESARRDVFYFYLTLRKFS